MRPFEIVKDRGFLSLMKTGRPGYYVPSPSTVSRDVKQVFARTRARVAEMLQVCGYCTHIQRHLNGNEEIRRETQLWDGCLDVSEPSGIYCCNSPFRT